MNDHECNRIIAEFMGLEFHVNSIDGNGYINNGVGYALYTDSLDALVPVLSKLQIEARKIDDSDGLLDFELSIDDYSGGCTFFIESNWGKIDISEGAKTIQQAAAYTTAKAILELNKPQ